MLAEQFFEDMLQSNRGHIEIREEYSGGEFFKQPSYIMKRYKQVGMWQYFDMIIYFQNK